MKRILKIIVVVIFIIALFCAIIYLNINKLYDNGNVSSTLDFEHSKWIELPVTVNDKDAKTIFDTGVNFICVAEASSVEKYKIRKIPFLRALINSTQWEELGLIDSLKIGDFEFKNVPVVIMDFKSNNSSLTCVDSDFIIGMSLISQLIWDFDFEKKELSLSKENNTYDISDSNKLEYKGIFSPQLSVKVGDTEHKVLMDFGFVSTLNLKADTSLKGNYNFQSTGDENIFGKYANNGYSAIEDVILNRDTLKNVSIQYSETLTADKNIIGLGVFSMYRRVILNPYKKALYLCNAFQYNRFKYNYGFGFNIHRKNNFLLVSYIDKGSSAYQMNIAVGDTIEKIGNYSVDDLCSMDYCDFLEQRNLIFQADSIGLKIRNNDTLKVIKKTKYSPGL